MCCQNYFVNVPTFTYLKNLNKMYYAMYVYRKYLSHDVQKVYNRSQNGPPGHFHAHTYVFVV